MTDEMEELREAMARVRAEAKSILGSYGESDIMSDTGDDRFQSAYANLAHIDDEGCDEDVSYRRVEIPGYFDTDPGHDDFSQPKQDINALLYTMMDLIDLLMRSTSEEKVAGNYAELLAKTQVAAENYRAVSQRYWPDDTDNTDIAKHLFEELKIEIERMRAETATPPAPAPQP